MKWSWIGRTVMALMSAVALGLSMTACGGGTIAYLWATGTTGTNNTAVVGYMVDDFTGNLTAIPGQPFSSNGVSPITLLVRPGGRFVYVINQGTGYTSTSNGTGDGIDAYAVGGEGTLTFQQHYETQGFGHVWAAFDSTGSYLYVLDQYSPSYQSDPNKSGFDVNGAITTFSSDPTTGRLNLVQQTASTLAGQPSPNYIEVGQSPIRMASTGSCLFTLNSVGQTVTTYSIASGQLNTVTTGLYPVGSKSFTNISGNGQYMFITDSAGGNNPGYIYSYSVGASCALTPFTTQSITPNDQTVTNPNNVLLTTSAKYVYVLNGPSTNTSTITRGSTLTAWNIINGQLSEISNSPFSTGGSGPVCAVEDPTAKYIYVASADGSITGYQYADTTGQLAPLQRGSNFTTSAKQLTCIALSGVV